MSVSAQSWISMLERHSGSLLELSFVESDANARGGGASDLGSRSEKDVSECIGGPFSSWTSIDELLALGSKLLRSP